MKNPITPAGMTYERAFEIALAAADFLGCSTEEPTRFDASIRALHARGLSDQLIADEVGIKRAAVNYRRGLMGLPANHNNGRRSGDQKSRTA